MDLEDTRDKLANTLAKKNVKIVFAESCTAGLCAATMGQVEGISEYLCGSAVSYRPATKRAWLNVQASTIQRHTCESVEVAAEMALNILEKTPEADFSASVVGDIGDAAIKKVVYVSIASRDETPIGRLNCAELLRTATRTTRQREAAEFVLRMLQESIDE